MHRDAVLATLRAHREELAALGIAHAALFGSRARDDATEASDIDILIDFEPGRVPDIYTFVGLRQRIAELFPIPVDVVDEGGLRPRMRAAIERDLIRAF
jgi:predicted nucleotidyltransferase